MGFPIGMGIPRDSQWEWELVTKLGMGMGRNGNRLHGNGRERECKKPFRGISTQNAVTITGMGADRVRQLRPFSLAGLVVGRHRESIGRLWLEFPGESIEQCGLLDRLSVIVVNAGAVSAVQHGVAGDFVSTAGVRRRPLQTH